MKIIINRSLTVSVDLKSEKDVRKKQLISENIWFQADKEIMAIGIKSTLALNSSSQNVLRLFNYST